MRAFRIVVIGSFGFDHIMELPARLQDWLMPDQLDQVNVSYTVSTLQVNEGGTGGNCVYTLGLLGEKPVAVGVLGKDGYGYIKKLKNLGVDVNNVRVVKEVLSAAGHVMTDQNQNQIWFYYPGPLKKMAAFSLNKMVRKGDVVALLPSEPTVFVKHLQELVKMKARFLFDPSFFVPNLKKADLVLGLKQAEIVIGNEYEIEMMEQKLNLKVGQWPLREESIVIKTKGERGVEIFQNQEIKPIPAIKLKKVVDPTGAGDAFRAGFLAGYINHKSIIDCAKMGVLAGAYCVQAKGTQGHKFTQLSFRRRLYGKEKKL